MPFVWETIVSVEFGVYREAGAGGPYALVPVDVSVQNALKEMSVATRVALASPPDENGMVPYDPSQKYSSTESLRLPLDSQLCNGPRSLYNAHNIAIDVQAMTEPNAIEYYFAVFRDNQNNKAIGVRRAMQFKGVLSAQGRLIRWLDQTLQILNDTIFKLDTVFDYLITEHSVFILHPSSFEYTADIDDQILAHAATNIQALAQTVVCINFHGLGAYAATHKRAARLLASLRTRADLAQTSLERLTALCQETGIEVEIVGGRIGPRPGREMDFLMLLDRRRYAVSLIEGVDETYEAANRRNVGVAAHPPAAQ